MGEVKDFTNEYKINIKYLKVYWKIVLILLISVPILPIVSIVLILQYHYIVGYILLGIHTTYLYILFCILSYSIGKRASKCPSCNKHCLRGLQKFCPNCAVLLYNGKTENSMSEMFKFAFSTESDDRGK